MQSECHANLLVRVERDPPYNRDESNNKRITAIDKGRNFEHCDECNYMVGIMILNNKITVAYKKILSDANLQRMSNKDVWMELIRHVPEHLIRYAPSLESLQSIGTRTTVKQYEKLPKSLEELTVFPDVYTNIVLKNSGNAIKFIQIAGWYYENDGDETSKQYMIVFAHAEGLDELTKAKSFSIDGTVASIAVKMVTYMVAWIVSSKAV